MSQNVSINYDQSINIIKKGNLDKGSLDKYPLDKCPLDKSPPDSHDRVYSLANLQVKEGAKKIPSFRTDLKNLI